MSRTSLAWIQQELFIIRPMSRLKIYRAMLVCLALVSTPAYTDIDLPDLGDSGAATITVAEEKRTGATVLRNLRHAGLIVDDALITDYLNQLGYKLLSHHNYNSQTTFEFFLVNDNGINAFALPGGYIGINYGLFQQTETESELASVMAHEIAHVTQRHYARAYDLGTKSELPVLAAIIAAIVLGSQDGELGEAAMATAVAAQAQKQINFTRQNEYEADRIGIQILSQAGFDPGEMASFFDKLDRQSRLYGIEVPEFLRTHPINASRITEARGRARLLPPPKTTTSLSYQIMRERIVALASRNKQRTEKQYQLDLKTKKGDALTATRYGYTLSLMRQEKYTQAKQHIEILLKQYPHRIAFLLAKAQIQTEAKEITHAIKTYRDALTLYPHNEAISYELAALLVVEKQYKPAKTLLDNLLKSTPRNPAFYKLMAQTEAALGHQAQSHAAQAEYYYQIGQFHQAIDQINIALKTKPLDFYTASKLEAKLASIKQEAPKNQTER